MKYHLPHLVADFLPGLRIGALAVTLFAGNRPE